MSDNIHPDPTAVLAPHDTSELVAMLGQIGLKGLTSVMREVCQSIRDKQANGEPVLQDRDMLLQLVEYAGARGLHIDTETMNLVQTELP